MPQMCGPHLWRLPVASRVGPDDVSIVSLTTRALPAPERPLSSRELFELSQLYSFAELRDGVPPESAGRRAELTRRAEVLLQREAAVAAALENWENSGLWTMTVSSVGYPRHLQERLGPSAPAVLHGFGDSERLHTLGLGVAGSRAAVQRDIDRAKAVGVQAAEHDLALVAGAARGVDAAAMDSAIGAGGCAVGVLAESLVKAVSRSETRRHVLDGSLVLVSPFSPEAPFSTGAAMGRNRIIYALSCTLVVVACEAGRGGTWAGAVEALNAGWTDVAVWQDPDGPPGNAALAELGARRVSDASQLLEVLYPDSADEQLTLDL